ncbi:carboxymuconolactone decarboxylase family protein [Pseudofrankia sp. BMG5.37]|nr:carboxymuconolactone decarboxylase family protein [Pseudofrankia sp. BMG5.36]MDT3446449.1 carboxymuconolactone decarboxylase family protein [Pseudofrankia sp. BMG5.37]OHV57187.1 carboxymuconolactone decarboxylase [Pseudofrankia sp. BMG5.36]
MDRISPLPPGAWPREMRAAMSALLPEAPRHPLPSSTDKPTPLHMLGIFAHHPTLARAFFTFNAHALLTTALSERRREILILRVATLRQCSYEWAEHVFLARDAGLNDDEIAGIARGADAPCWDPIEAALVCAADQLIADGAIHDSTWAALAETLNVQELLDVIFTVGAYETLAWMLRSCAAQPETGLKAT